RNRSAFTCKSSCLYGLKAGLLCCNDNTFMVSGQGLYDVEGLLQYSFLNNSAWYFSLFLRLFCPDF
ncbi:MAG: hypothetical protein ACFNM6_02425, partial [Prevotella sp.]